MYMGDDTKVKVDFLGVVRRLHVNLGNFLNCKMWRRYPQSGEI